MHGALIVCYAAISQFIFNCIHQTTHRVIDEEFHIPQGLQYCNFNFSTWDPKITTLPGLYLVSAVILGPLNLCDVYLLRYVSYIAGLINLALFYVILKKVNKEFSTMRLWVAAINVSLLPPLYFFNNLYYTDIVSITSIMVMIVLSLEKKHFLVSLSAVVTILIRQTNVIWFAFVVGRYFLNNYFHYCLKKRTVEKEAITEKDVKTISAKDFKNAFAIQHLPAKFYVNFLYYVSPMFGFVVFVVLNKGIVVGDKTAHVAVLHIPQIFYFSLFCLIFALPHHISSIIPFLKYVSKRKSFVAITLVLMGVVVRYNTLVHPYLLADNRHYTFYVWSRFYDRIWIFRYVMIVPYFFGFYSTIRHLYSRDDTTFILLYIICTVFVLVPQKMIEVRYFLVPFILFRLNVRHVSYKLLIVECIYYILINIVTLRLFFVKNIYWSDFDYAQKLIW